MDADAIEAVGCPAQEAIALGVAAEFVGEVEHRGIGARMHLDPLIVMLAVGIWLRNWSRADASELTHNFQAAQLPVFLVFFALAGTKLDVQTLWASLLPVGIIAVIPGQVGICSFSPPRRHWCSPSSRSLKV